MSVRVGINGFGRIGRNFLRAAKAQGADIDFVAVNDLGNLETMAHLLRRDSVAGAYPGTVEAVDGGIKVDGDTITVVSHRDPAEIPWGEFGVDVVIESTGIFTDRDKAAAHLAGGAPRVIVSAPANGADATFVVGVNDDTFDPASHIVVSNASCTTNCFVPMIKVLDDAFGVEKGLMTTTHAYTGDQVIVDGPHSDLRRARAAAVNIVPTSTGAARATGLVLVTDFVGNLKREVTVEEVNEAFKAAASEGRLKGILEYSTEPLVSSDIVGSSYSSIIDSGLTMAIGNMVKVLSWYDNETGYSNRLVDLAKIVGAANH